MSDNNPANKKISEKSEDIKDRLEEKEETIEERKKRRKKLLLQIDRLEEQVKVSAENGLFKIIINKVEASEKPQEVSEDKVQKESYNQILENIELARKALEQNDPAQCEFKLSLAIKSYSQVLNSAPPIWRFSNVYGGYMWIYMIGVLASVFFVFYYHHGILESNLGVEQSALNATAWGIIGAVLKGIWILKEDVGERIFRNSMKIYFISIPFLGGILGALIYILVKGGLFALSTNTSTINPFTIIPLAALAGYNSYWAISFLDRLGEIFTSNKNLISEEKT